MDKATENLREAVRAHRQAVVKLDRARRVRDLAVARASEAGMSLASLAQELDTSQAEAEQLLRDLEALKPA